ncbi:hypothetical protein C8J56DRAFT_880880 [Mycena floridula]|nr:hypothetical protein C8J56DRAFT_880880 [Mycena floridula]
MSIATSSATHMIYICISPPLLDSTVLVVPSAQGCFDLFHGTMHTVASLLTEHLFMYEKGLLQTSDMLMFIQRIHKSLVPYCLKLIELDLQDSSKMLIWCKFASRVLQELSQYPSLALPVDSAI